MSSGTGVEICTLPSLKRGPRSKLATIGTGGSAGRFSMAEYSVGSSSFWPPIVTSIVAL